ncbi:hypothetical protein [Erythrobacter sp. HL-111]|uniref:hypothetical protein n=1 Tax=Erythrobacter sp. HL-111 TaxID=1798193 RepID=UPI0006DB3B9E|nr:hypothetical protein [Erythrobacter sp. HL-111]KPP95451.1 MAG: hypothetical protein HLUCCO15_02230 [Erythrobacteraceae bacterium HL-111]SDS71170.1 hypothetical protein SAMN04515621_2080 [Erythrobacter sp. HL-111]
MFEKVNSILPQAPDLGAGGEARSGPVREVAIARARPERAGHEDVQGAGLGSGRGGNALRAIDWGELNARLGAARDLRVLLRRDAKLNIEATAASFGDAAARYFAALEHGERPVNPDDLEARKASHGILRSKERDAATGDARED